MTSNIEKKTSSVSEVFLDNMFVDHETPYQRPLDEKRSKNIAESFDYKRLGVPVVSARPDGRFAIIDGQHRVAALKLRRDEGSLTCPTAILCEVHYGLTVQEEAALFDILNGRGHSKPTSKYDEYNARLIAGYPEEREIANVLDAFGLRLGPSRSEKMLGCVVEVRAAQQRGNLANTLTALTLAAESAAGTDVAAFDALVVRAVSVFLAAHPEVRSTDGVKRLADGLGKRGFSAVIATLKAARNTMPSFSADQRANAVITTLYNSSRKGGPRANVNIA